MGSATTYFTTATASTLSFGSWDRIIFTVGAWTSGSTWTIAGTSLQGNFTLGIGYLGADHTPSNYNIALTFGKRVYIGQKAQVVFSALGDATGWNQQDAGAGFFLVLNQQGQQDVVYGLCPFQGRLAVLGRYNVQLWNVNADPSQFQWIQTLANIGTPSPFSVIGIGDLDAIFVDDAGIRGLRPLVTTLNATIESIGSAVDSLVVAAMEGVTATSIVSTVDPDSKRYWIAIGSTIYVLSYFPEVKIQAWSTYVPTDSGDQSTLTPQWFSLYSGQVMMRATNNKIYAYGGIIKGTPVYDSSLVTVKTPWLDHKKPKQRKSSESLGVAAAGVWTVKASMQPSAGAPTVVVSATGSASTPLETTDSTVDLPVYPYSEDGTHIQILATTSTAGSLTNPVKFSLLAWQYNPAENE